MGSIEMLSGLDYHYNNIELLTPKIDIMDVIKQEKLGELANIYYNYAHLTSNCKHEIVAYLNRLYQFQVFFESELSKPHIKNITRSEIAKALKFRHNLTGKRLLDSNSDLSELLKDQARYSDLTVGTHRNSNGFIFLQIYLKNEGIVQYCVQKNIWIL